MREPGSRPKRAARTPAPPPRRRAVYVFHAGRGERCVRARVCGWGGGWRWRWRRGAGAPDAPRARPTRARPAQTAGSRPSAACSRRVPSARACRRRTRARRLPSTAMAPSSTGGAGARRTAARGRRAPPRTGTGGAGGGGTRVTARGPLPVAGRKPAAGPPPHPPAATSAPTWGQAATRARARPRRARAPRQGAAPSLPPAIRFRSFAPSSHTYSWPSPKARRARPRLPRTLSSSLGPSGGAPGPAGTSLSSAVMVEALVDATHGEGARAPVGAADRG